MNLLNWNRENPGTLTMSLDNLRLKELSDGTADVEFIGIKTNVYGESVPVVPFEFVFTPKHGSWLNLVEGFFSKLTRQMLKGIRVKTKDELVQRIYRYFDEVNEQPVVYHWKYKLEEINSSEEVVVDTLPIQKSS